LHAEREQRDAGPLGDGGEGAGAGGRRVHAGAALRAGGERAGAVGHGGAAARPAAGVRGECGRGGRGRRAPARARGVRGEGDRRRERACSARRFQVGGSFAFWCWMWRVFFRLGGFFHLFESKWLYEYEMR